MADIKNFAKKDNLPQKGQMSLLAPELPHSEDAEIGLLASMILDSDNSTVVNACIVAKLTPEYFFYPKHQKIYAAILSLNSDGMPCDIVTLTEALLKRGDLNSVGGPSAIADIANRLESFAHFKTWLEIVREKYFIRALIRSCTKAIEDAYKSQGDFENFIDGVEQQIMQISQDRISDTAQSINGEIDKAVGIINKMIQGKGSYTGVPTGFTDLDNVTRGLQNKEMIVIAARPGMGKTSIALNMAESAMFAYNKPTKVLVFSLEMSADLLAMRMICSRAKLDQETLRKGSFLNSDKQKDLIAVARELKNGMMWIEDTSDMTILEMRAKARRMKQQHDIGLIIVDYLQLLKGTDSRVPREQQVAEISRGMKAMAKELDLPVVVLAQLNRETEKDNRDPRPSDLRESGSIEQDADLILLLNWKKKDGDEQLTNSQRLVKLIIAKHRNGPTGVVDLVFNRNYTRFDNYLPTKDENA
ncbi:MAG: replicative DNA helicase [Opitutales bacterium]|nr:replicative DNA helicase [Opitutales bacterium]